MLKLLSCAAAVVAASVTCAAAQTAFVDWRGGVILTSISGCDAAFGSTFSNGVNRTFAGRYRHPGLGPNGPDAKLSLLHQFYAFNFTHLGGPFTKTLSTVKMVSIAGGATGTAVNGKLKITDQSPANANIDENTPMITLEGQIKGFSGFPGSATCVVSFSGQFFRP
jgi:hypothetical protein